MAVPSNPALYERIKKKVYKKNPKHSAYRSSQLVREYKAAGGGYKGKKPTTKDKGLKRWHKEDWRTREGSKTYKKKGDIFRPTKRVTKQTPTTMSELSKKQKDKATKEKKATGRVKKYKR